jgi:hypothetical protein
MNRAPRYLVLLLLAVLAGAVVVATGCGATEADLTTKLLTTQDSAERIRVAARLAEMASVAATQQPGPTPPLSWEWRRCATSTRRC